MSLSKNETGLVDAHLSEDATCSESASEEFALNEDAPSEKSEYVHGVFTKIAPSYDLMNDLESLGMHRSWKARLVRELSAPNAGGSKPKDILDIACGTGDIAIALAKANPKAQVTGLDFCEEMLVVARERAKKEFPVSFVMEIDASTATKARSKKNLTFIQGNAMHLPFENNSFDAVSISFGLRNMPDYGAVLAEILRVLRPGGCFRCLESSYPTNPVIKPPFKLYFKHWLPVLGKLVVKSEEEYSWLNTSTENFLTKDELAALMSHVGFRQVGYASFLFGAAALHKGTAPAE